MSRETLVAHPVVALDTFLPGRPPAVTHLAVLVLFDDLVVHELLQSDQENVALHRPHSSWWHFALCLADWTQKCLAGSHLRLRQTAVQTVEAETVKTRKKFGRIVLVVTNRTIDELFR